MPIVSLPSVMTNAPLSGACRVTASRYIRKCMEISEWSFHSNRFDFVVRRILVAHVLPVGDLPERGVDSVRVRRGRMQDEELAAAGVFPGVGQGQRPRVVLGDFLRGLAFEGVAGPAGADASLPGLRNRVTTLNHEVRDHAVKLGAVIESRVREFLEVRDHAGHFVGEQLHVDSALRGFENGLFVRHHHSRERFSSTCATVFIPTITTDTASLSSTNRSASCAGVTPAWPARSFTRSATAVSCATKGRGMRARMSPLSHVLSRPYFPASSPLASGSRAITPTLDARATTKKRSSASRRTRLYTIWTVSGRVTSTAASPSSGGCTDTP